MNDSNDPTNVPDAVTSEQETANSLPVAPQQPRDNTSEKVKIAIIAAIIVLLLVLIPVAYTLGRMQSVVDLTNNVSTDTSSVSDTKPAEGIEETPVEISNEYDGWDTYENERYGYSFQYPSDWQVDKKVIQGESDWVSINPKSEANANNGDVLAIFTYADGTGCPTTKTKEFSVGGHSVEGTACIETEVYKVGMRHSKVASSGNGGVVLVRTAPDMIGVQIDLGSGQDEAIQRILDSITGLTPYSN